VISERTFFGGHHAQALPAMPTVLTIAPQLARLWCLRPSAGGQRVELVDPDDVPRRVRVGDEIRIWNTDGAISFDVADAGGSTLFTLAPDEIARIVLANEGDEAFTDAPTPTWEWRKRARLT